MGFKAPVPTFPEEGDGVIKHTESVRQQKGNNQQKGNAYFKLIYLAVEGLGFN